MLIRDIGRTWSPEPESEAGVRSPAIVNLVSDCVDRVYIYIYVCE